MRQKIEEAVDALISTRSPALPPISPTARITAVHTLLAVGPRPGKHRKKRVDQIQDLRVKQIREIAEAARRLHDALISGQDAARLIFRHPATLQRSVSTMKVIAETAATGEINFAGLATEPPNAAHRFATEIAYIFLILTGRRPALSVDEGTARGPFLDFVAAVFAARGLEDSAESSARAGIAAMKNRRPKTRP